MGQIKYRNIRYFWKVTEDLNEQKISDSGNSPLGITLLFAFSNHIRIDLVHKFYENHFLFMIIYSLMMAALT
jgi:hypothetical protein